MLLCVCLIMFQALNTIMPKNNLSRKVDGSGTTMLVVLKLGILVRCHTSLIKIAGLLQPPSC